MPVAPTDEHVDRPDPRPIQTRRPVQKALPKPPYRIRFKARGAHKDWIAHRAIDHLPQPTAQPTIVRKHKPRFGVIEQRRVEAAQANTAQQ